MKCPHCDEEIQDGAAKCRWCKEFIKADGQPRPAGRRPLANAESERLITMACLTLATSAPMQRAETGGR